MCCDSKKGTSQLAQMRIWPLSYLVITALSFLRPGLAHQDGSEPTIGPLSRQVLSM